MDSTQEGDNEIDYSQLETRRLSEVYPNAQLFGEELRLDDII